MYLVILTFLLSFHIFADDVFSESRIDSLAQNSEQDDICHIYEESDEGEIVDLANLVELIVEAVKPVEISPVSLGARKALAVYFQSCSAITTPIDRYTNDLVGVIDGTSIDGEEGFAGGYIRKITDIEAYVNSHIILKNLKQDPNYPEKPHCSDMTLSPPVYGYASRVSFDKKQNEINIFNKGRGVTTTSANAVSVDCSGFVSTALAAAGLKSKTTSNSYTSQTTRTLASDLESEKSCLRNEMISPLSTIQAGNIINLAGRHTIIVDKIGDDPLGIDKFSKQSNCDEISPRDFDFTYIHSGTTNNSYGPVRVNANTHWGGGIWNNLRAIAVDLCKRRLEGESGEFLASDIEGVDKNLSLIRHDSKRKECVSENPPKLKGEECINKCLEQKENRV